MSYNFSTAWSTINAYVNKTEMSKLYAAHRDEAKGVLRFTDVALDSKDLGTLTCWHASGYFLLFNREFDRVVLVYLTC